MTNQMVFKGLELTSMDGFDAQDFAQTLDQRLGYGSDAPTIPTLRIKRSGTYTLRGKSNDACVDVHHNVGWVHLILRDVEIDVRHRKAAAVTMRGNQAAVELYGVNALMGGAAGLKNETGDMMINGVGVLNATGGDGAPGIGGSFIAIEGGFITAKGGEYAAGIGSGGCIGGPAQDARNISINGGIVYAYGGNGGAGIGACVRGTGSSIAIRGGKVVAQGGIGAAGIGGGHCTDGRGGGGGTDIVISGGEIEAKGGDYGGAAMGGGAGSWANEVTIYGGTVVATGGVGAPAFTQDVKISGGEVTAHGGLQRYAYCSVEPGKYYDGIEFWSGGSSWRISGGKIKSTRRGADHPDEMIECDLRAW